MAPLPRISELFPHLGVRTNSQVDKEPLAQVNTYDTKLSPIPEALSQWIKLSKWEKAEKDLYGTW